jgi:YVTN family beta-propeller protein
MMPKLRTAAYVLAMGLLGVSCSASGSSDPPTASLAPSTSSVPARPPPVTAQEVRVVNVYSETRGDLSPAVAHFPSRVYVPNSESSTVDVIDPSTYKVIDHFSVAGGPQHVTPSWDLQKLYVDNTSGNTLTPIDPMTGKHGKDIPVNDPYNLYFTPDGSRAIVVAEREWRLDFYDPLTWKRVESMSIAHAGLDHIDFSADGHEALVSAEFSGWVVKVDLVGMKVAGELRVGGSPIDVKLSPDGSVYYVANQDRGGVSVIDPQTMKEISFIDTGAGAHGLYVSRDTASLYVTNRLAGSISVIDLATRKVTATWKVGGSPDMGGVSTDGTQLWVSSRNGGSVLVIDARSGSLLHSIAVGRGPHGLSIFPQPGRYSLGHTGVFR